MATLAEKLRACAVLGGFVAVDVEDSDGDQREVLTLSGDDLKTIADALDDSEQLAQQRDDALAAADDIRIHNARVEALASELDAAKAEAAALRAKIEKSAADTKPVAWLVGGQSPVVTTSAAAAQICIMDGLSVVPLYRHPPVPEALPSREDLETVLRTAFDSGRVRLGADTVLFGERSGLIELNGRFCERDDGTPATFAQAVKVCADLVRAQEEEG